jgi:hypothetical protein
VGSVRSYYGLTSSRHQSLFREFWSSWPVASPKSDGAFSRRKGDFPDKSWIENMKQLKKVKVNRKKSFE